MTRTVDVPLWLLILLLAVAAWAALDRLLLPSVRWFLRSRANRVLEEVRSRFQIEIRPFQLTRRRVVIDRGTTQGVVAGSPVINEAGVLGQVTRVYPLSAEVTLLTDKDAAIPVLNQRSRQRGAAYGGAGGMELRFMAGNADVQEGDLLATSGVDGVYPPGLPVAKVVTVDRKVDSGFARIVLAPAASADGVRHVLVLEPLGLQMPARPEAEAEPANAAPARKGGPRK